MQEGFQMAIDIRSLGSSIRRTREAIGFTQDQMAAEFSVSRPTYSDMEKGLRAPTLDQLARLSELANVPLNSFLECSTETEQGLVALLRLSSGHDDAASFKREIKKSYRICQIGARLSAKLGVAVRSGPRAYSCPIPKSTGAAFSQGIWAAKQERKRLGIGSRPIPDMADLITSQNIWASGAALPDEISGLFLRERELGMVVLVNGKHNRARKRFSYGHEYAHALLDSTSFAQISDSKSQSNLCEVRANAFAAEFLLPEHGIDEFLTKNGKGDTVRLEQFVYEGEEGNAQTKRRASKRTATGSKTIKPFDVSLLANEFGVSYEAACYRLNSTRNVNRKELDQLLNESEFAKKALFLLGDKIYKVDHERKDRDLVLTVIMLTIRALQNSLISKSELIPIADELGFSWEEFLEFKT